MAATAPVESVLTSPSTTRGPGGTKAGSTASASLSWAALENPCKAVCVLEL
jgi:hypothetical protein